MLGDLKTNEWNLVKDQFDVLVHDKSVHEDSLEKFLDDQIRRRFGELISRAAERKNKNLTKYKPRLGTRHVPDNCLLYKHRRPGR